jgi:hypothetical protein
VPAAIGMVKFYLLPSRGGVCSLQAMGGHPIQEVKPEAAEEYEEVENMVNSNQIRKENMVCIVKQPALY